MMTPLRPGRPAATSEVPARPGRAGRRVHALARLALLLGGPFFVIFMIFALGVYCGVAKRESVLAFEVGWLGWSAEPDAPAEPSEPTKTEPTKTEPTKTEPAKTESAKTEPAKPEPAKPEPAKPEPAKPEPAKPEPAKPEPRFAIVEVEPLAGELGELLAQPRALAVKVMVDPAVLVDKPDTWLGYVDELVRSTSASFERAFGITLELRGVVVWERASTGAALIDELAACPREGADLLVGLAMQPPPLATNQTPAREDGVVIAYADAGASDRFHRPLLRVLAAAFGAQPLRDAGTWMSEAPPAPGAALRIDAANRALVIRNKWTRPTPQSPPTPPTQSPPTPGPQSPPTPGLHPQSPLTPE